MGGGKIFEKSINGGVLINGGGVFFIFHIMQLRAKNWSRISKRHITSLCMAQNHFECSFSISFPYKMTRKPGCMFNVSYQQTKKFDQKISNLKINKPAMLGSLGSKEILTKLNKMQLLTNFKTI